MTLTFTPVSNSNEHCTLLLAINHYQGQGRPLRDREKAAKVSKVSNYYQRM